MDTSLTQFLDVWFAEKYPEGHSQPVTKPDGYHMKRFGALRTNAALDGPGPFPIKYSWRDTMAALEEIAQAGETDPYDGAVLDYVNPQSGGPTTATLHCRVQMLRPGKATRSHRHACSTVYFVVRGAGESRVGKSKVEENTLQWGERTVSTFLPGIRTALPIVLPIRPRSYFPSVTGRYFKRSGCIGSSRTRCSYSHDWRPIISAIRQPACGIENR